MVKVALLLNAVFFENRRSLAAPASKDFTRLHDEVHRALNRCCQVTVLDSAAKRTSQSVAALSLASRSWMTSDLPSFPPVCKIPRSAAECHK